MIKGFRNSIIILILIHSFIPSSSIYAIHKGAGNLVCGNCHTMHNSQGNTGMGGASGGSLVLLKADVTSRANSHRLCMQCHASNGVQANTSHTPQNVIAPKVYSSGAWTENNPFNLIGAGGNFYTELSAAWDTTTPQSLGYGHSLGATTVLPPGGDANLDYLTCINCHDPHGTASDSQTGAINLYRNLRVNAVAAGANSGANFYTITGGSEVYKMKSYVGSVNGAYFGGSEVDSAGQVIWPVYRGVLTGNVATDTANTNVYGLDEPASGYKRMASWCSQCHDNWHEDLTPSNKVVDGSKYGTAQEYDYRHWTRHPVSTTIHRGSEPGCAAGCHGSVLDRTNYSLALIQAGKALPVSAGYRADSTVWDPGAAFTNFVYYLPWCDVCLTNTGWEGMEPGIWNGPQVFCLTCHFAHGGPYYDALRWNYLSAVSPGNETGNAVASNIGCQLCHNRGAQ